MGRAPCCEKVGLKRGRWTSEEDEILRKYIEDNGEGSWRSLPKNAGLLRCGKSCRLRWINYLRSDLKRGNISSEEEEIIINLHASLGNRWSVIAGHLAGRTDNEIKNYWNSHLSRKIHSFRRPNPQFIPPAVVAKRPGRRSTRKSKKSDEKSNPRAWEERGVNAGVVMPTTPIPEKESFPSTTVINGSDVIPDSSPLQEGMESLAATGTEERDSWDALMLPINEGTEICSGMGMENGVLCLDDIIEDFSGIWGLEKEVIMDSRAEESGTGNGDCWTGNNSRDEESGPGNGNCSSELQKLGEWNLMASPGDSREWHWGEEDTTFSWFWDAER